MTATLEQAQAEWAKLIALAQLGEEIVITSQGRAIAKLTGVPHVKPLADRKTWLARLARLRKATATGKSAPSTEDILDDLRSERG